MVEPLSVDPSGVRALGDIHTGVAAGLGSLTASTPGAAPVAASHGTIAAAVDTALSGALGSRSATMTGVQAAGTLISELLHQSAAAYERGDQRGGDAIRAAADRLAQDQDRPAAAATGGSPAGGGADAMGQAMGQLGQLGQIGQQLVAPLAALAQPLQQLPQQLMQGLQQMGQKPSGATDPQAHPPAVEEHAQRPEAERTDEQDPEERADDGAAPQAAAEPAPMPPADQRPAATRPAIT